MATYSILGRRARRFIWLAGAAAIVPVAGTPALAQTGGVPAGAGVVTQPAPATAAPPAAGQPAAPAKPAEEIQSGEVLVIAERGPNAAIDRKSYTVKQGPAAEIADGMDVMRDLPSVTVDAAGKIELLGNANVKILIDGRPVPDALSVLRAMNAAQILKIEVITNPSAQFPADGTAGIINVVTRRSSRDGMSGALSAGADSNGSIMLRAAPTWSQGKWTLSTSPTFFRQRTDGKSSVERRQLAGPPNGITNRDEVGESKTAGSGFAQRTQVVYRPDQKRSFAAAFAASSFRRLSELENDVTASDGSFAPFAQDIANRGRVKAANLALDYRAEGNLPGELFTVAASGSAFTFDADTAFRETAQNGTSAALFSDIRLTDRTAQLKVDYATPLGPTKRLSTGASIDLNRRTLIDRTFGSSLLGPARDSFSDFGGDYRELGAYATFQAQVGDWKFMPGLRAQSRDYSLDDLGGDGPSRTDFFPSVFAERKFGKAWTGVASYSRRIAWPDVGDLSPVVRYQSPTFAFSGNPDLEPETTDAFELRLSRAGKIHSFDLTAYHRITHDTFDRAVTLQPDGLLLSVPVNAGRKVDQGLEAAFRGRILPSLRYTLTGNLTSVDRAVGFLGNRDRSTQYRGKLQLDYTQGKAADPGYDQLTFNLRYEGPVQQFQTERSDFVDADLTWTHRFTPKLALVTSVFALFGGAEIESTTRTPFFSERRVDRPNGRAVRLTLTYQLGDKPQPLPPQQSPGVPSIPNL